MSEHVLEISGLDAYYGSAHVLHELSCSVGQRTTGIVGRNGMGKSTLCKAIMGITPPRARGSIRFAGEEILGRPSYDICRRGSRLRAAGTADLPVADHRRAPAHARQIPGRPRAVDGRRASTTSTPGWPSAGR